MSDSIDTSMKDGDVPFEPERLLHDLKSMPKISAPMDFQYHLSDALSQIDSEIALPWWKRFFRPAADGGFRIPALAYGSAAVMVLMIVSVYVISVTNVEQDLQQEFDSSVNPAKEDPVSEEVPASDNFLKESEAAPLNSEQMQPSSLLPAKPRGESQSEDLMELKKKTGEAAAPATESLPRKNDRQSGRTSTVPAAAAEPQAKSTEKMEFRTRGLLLEDEDISVQDSAMSDSLRKLDSLRRLKLDSRAKPLNDPR